MDISSLPEFIVNLIGSYIHAVQCEKQIVCYEYLIKRRKDILIEVNEILNSNQYTKREIGKVAEVFFNDYPNYPKNTVERQRTIDYQPKGCRYVIYTRDILKKSVLGNIFSEIRMITDSLKYDGIRCFPLQMSYEATLLHEGQAYRRAKLNAIHRLHDAYLLLSVCKYVSKSK